jgi:hypothetical protein
MTVASVRVVVAGSGALVAGRGRRRRRVPLRAPSPAGKEATRANGSLRLAIVAESHGV